MAVRLGELAAAVPGGRLVVGSADLVPTAVVHDSRRVGPGAVFVSLPGRRHADTGQPVLLGNQAGSHFQA